LAQTFRSAWTHLRRREAVQVNAQRISRQQEVGVMIEHTSHASPQSNPAATESLKMLLDYAIVEGTQLRLPVLVLLLRMANLELAKCGRPELHLNSADTPSLCDAGERVAS
jgi:hypothetical protein